MNNTVLSLILKIIITVILLSSYTIADVGDPDPYGIEDTLILFPYIDWDNNTVELEIYCFTDATINGSSIGFTWAYSTADLTMDSAVAAPLLNPVTIKWFYDDDNIATTNANKRFLLNTLDFGSGIPGNASDRRLWATYYFSLNWVIDDVVKFDTLTWNGSSVNLYSITSGSYSILVDGAVSDSTSMNINPRILNFDAVEECSNPSSKSFTITTEADSIPFMLSNNESWLTVTADRYYTPASIECNIDISSLQSDNYSDIITISSTESANSPQHV